MKDRRNNFSVNLENVDKNIGKSVGPLNANYWKKGGELRNISMVGTYCRKKLCGWRNTTCKSLKKLNNYDVLNE